MGLWSRQTGKDFSMACEIVEDCANHAKIEWLIGAAGERQALLSLDKVKEWAEAFHVAVADYTEVRASGEALIKSAKITWPNGSKVIAVPANPDTVRGYSANIVLTEFAFLEQPGETWRAMLPSITNPLRGGLKKVRLITTPNGKGNKTDELWHKEDTGRMRWSRHKVTIHDAVAQGLPIDVEELKEALDDPEGWAQEYECEFLDGSNVLLPYDLIALAESAEASEFCDPEFFASSPRSTGSGPKFLGIDYGRTNDPTVCCTLEQQGDILWTREILVLKGTDSPDQQGILRSRIAAAQRVCFDYTGPGIGLGDYMAKEFGVWEPGGHKFGKIELCTFTTAFKRELFPRLRQKFEAPTRVRVPISRAVREDLHAMQQVVSNGEYNYWAPRTKEGHSDRCTAFALAVRAAGEGGGMFAYEAVGRGRGMKFENGRVRL
jgi:phage FluMu gp28-like protein